MAAAPARDDPGNQADDRLHGRHLDHRRHSALRRAGGYRGGADHQYQTLGLLLYEQGWFNFQLGRAAATAWTMFLIIMVAVAVNALLASRGRSILGVTRRRRRA